MEPDLLVKIEVLFRPFSLPRVARVKDPGAVGIPGGASASGRILHSRDLVGELFAGVDLEKVQRSLFAAALGKGDRDESAIQRRNIPVNGSRAVCVQHI